MTPVDRRWFVAAARRLRRRHAGAVTLLGAAAAAAATGAAHLAIGTWPSALAVGLGAGLLVGFASLQPRRRQITPLALARHLNRTAPAFEESAELLLADPTEVAGLAALQQRRIAARLATQATPPALPTAVYRHPLAAAAVLGLLALVLILLPRGIHAAGGGGARAPSTDSASVEGVEYTIRLVATAVTPPGYTGLRPRRSTEWDLEVEEGAAVEWLLEASGPATGGQLTTAAGDTVPLVSRGERLVASLVASRSTLYRVHLDRADGGSVGFPDHRLAVTPDAPPVVTVIQPGPRTLVQPGSPRSIAVEALARDDHGVDAVGIVATVSKGQGEGVKFREQRLDFTTRAAREDGGLLLHRTLDLGALGLEPGDELYFHVVATDRRTPTPNEGRSETIFVTLVDPSRPVAGPGSGVALDVAPDYFRSQRQLIIDTEQLLADQRGLARQVFLDRSNGLGIDQGLLRLRYGQFMGDEFEGAMPASGREAHADDHAADPPPTATPPASGATPLPGEPPEDLLSELTHNHDDPENATLLAPQVKAKLRDAITAMWSSELHLRLGEPRRSLPFQHRALELLQEIRQDARAYVQRVGFEPPPLEPDLKRLSGKQDEIRAPALARSAAWRPGDPELREGLARLLRLARGGRRADDDGPALEQLGQALAQRAVEDAAWLLEPLHALREGIASLEPGATPCRSCLATAAQGVLRALGEVGPGAVAQRRPATGLEARYRLRLQTPR